MKQANLNKKIISTINMCPSCNINFKNPPGALFSHRFSCNRQSLMNLALNKARLHSLRNVILTILKLKF